MKRSRFAAVVGAALLGLSTLAACAEDEPAPSEDTPIAAEFALSTADVGDLGTVVVDGSGRTLYVFDKDTADPPKSNCEGECAAMWPPVEAGSGTPELDGVDASLVGTVDRSDGTQQLTLAGWPLYLFAKDEKAGEAKGQAVGDVWWVVSPDGKKITKKAPATTGGY
jgi:predicted lipoprotein with Yx(FWY)xxD motif